MAWIQRLFDRYFKFYFALTLLGFVIAILLMNTRLLAAEATQVLSSERALAVSSAAKPATGHFKNPLRVQVSNTKVGEMSGSGHFVEYQGNKLSFIIRF